MEDNGQGEEDNEAEDVDDVIELLRHNIGLRDLHNGTQ